MTVFVADADGHICVAPGMTVAKKGEWVLFINATKTVVTIKTPEGHDVFVGYDHLQGIKLMPLETKKLTVKSDANLHQPFMFDIPAARACPGYPGPGMDIDN